MATRIWTRPGPTTALEYLDDDGKLQLKTMALTPAHFALGEIRFKKQFRKLADDVANSANLVSIEDFIDLTEAQREGKVAFIYSVDSKKKLAKLGFTNSIVALVEERRKYWNLRNTWPASMWKR